MGILAARSARSAAGWVSGVGVVSGKAMVAGLRMGMWVWLGCAVDWPDVR